MAARQDVILTGPGLPSAVVLYGPPASGKDTVTAALHQLDERFELLHKRKIGSGRTSGYRQITRKELDDLRASGQVVYENERYGNVYAVDRPSLNMAVGRGRIPVVHMGQIEGIRALVERTPLSWLVVLLWCPREVVKQRLRTRGDCDPISRLEAWDETAADLGKHGREMFGLHMRTDRLTPNVVARRIRAQLPEAAAGREHT